MNKRILVPVCVLILIAASSAAVANTSTGRGQVKDHEVGADRPHRLPGFGT